ncbi:MAG TPA: hypothetical protein IAC12_09390 [Candidatus Aphodovivens avistercoris]|nr:hypothetical protein [Candidatus Aphodovivens avistercoris]
MASSVIYCSQTGSARRYAEWLAEELGCDARPVDGVDEGALDASDTVVLCGWFHAASIKGSKWFKRYMAAHPGKRYAVVAVGATPMPCELWPASEHEEAFRRSFPKEDYPDLAWCYCQGDFHFEKLGLADKIAMRMYFKMLEAEAKKGSRRDAEALAGMRAGIDGCDRSYLALLVARLKGRQGGSASGAEG